MMYSTTTRCLNWSGYVTMALFTLFLLGLQSACNSTIGPDLPIGPDPEVPETQTQAPGTVTNFAVDAVTEGAITLTWTQVSDGDGGSAHYLLRHGSPTISWGNAGAEEQQVSGGSPGNVTSFTWTGLQGVTDYQFQLITYRGTLNSNAVFGELSNIASATTGIGSQEVTGVTVTPQSPSIAVDERVQLTAVVLDTQGSTVSTTVAWNTLNPTIATVDGSGLVTGGSVGTARIMAETVGVSDTVSVTVTSAPSTATIYFEEDFEGASLSSRGWYDNTSLTLTSAEKVSGSTSLEVRFNQGATTPTFGGAARHLFDETESVYVSYWVKYSSNWVGSGRAYHPHDIQLITNEDGLYPGPRDTHLTTYIESTYQGGILPKLAMRDRLNIDTGNIGVDLTGLTESRAAGGCNGNRDGYTTDCYSLGGGAWSNEKIWPADGPFITEDEWHFVEAYFQLNTIEGGIGIPNGVARYWLDGVLALDLPGVLFRTGAHPTMRFRQFVFAPYIGDGSPVTQTMWVDDIRVANRR